MFELNTEQPKYMKTGISQIKGALFWTNPLAVFHTMLLLFYLVWMSRQQFELEKLHSRDLKSSHESMRLMRKFAVKMV